MSFFWRSVLLFAVVPLVLLGCSERLELQSDSLGIEIDGRGRVARISDVATGRDFFVRAGVGGSDDVAGAGVDAAANREAAELGSEAGSVADGASDAFRVATGALLSIRVDGVMSAPRSAAFDRDARTISLTYASGHEVVVVYEEKPSHIRLEVVKATPNESIELAVWGPYPTRLNEVIGETVGIVQGEGFAIGIQGLNPKSLGGFPWNENDAMPQIDIFESGDFSDLSPEGKRYVLYRVEAAKPDVFGSTLQVYTRNRNADRVVPNRGYDRYVAPAFDDGGIVGSRIALFGARSDSVLDTIGRIEVAEGLPHPMIDGVWGKKARSANAAYLIMEFSEADHERVIDVTRRAGLRYLYHPGPFETWGHFRLNPESFPSGVAGLKRVVDRAAESDIMVGVHTLSNFLTPNDAYASPVPDPRLARVGETQLAAAIDEAAIEIPLVSADFYLQEQEGYLDASVIGAELVRCTGLIKVVPGNATAGDAATRDGAAGRDNVGNDTTAGGNAMGDAVTRDGAAGGEAAGAAVAGNAATTVDTGWKLTDCERGAYGTTAVARLAGATVARLDDHAYNVFLTNADLSVEMATNLADLFNAAGLRQISFDGLEGNRSTGMGNYGEILFTNTWYEQLNNDIRGHYIADASRTSHYFWHMYTRMNWGEPWYAGFRESQTEYRLKNQPYFQRNLMPAMLGWFSMRAETSVEDVEWMLARSAGFDAGYGFVTGFEELEANGDTDRILALLGLWEEARMADVFPDSLQLKMQDIGNEYHLERSEDGGFALYPVASIKASHALRARQPGEPLTTRILFDSNADSPGVSVILTASGADVTGVALTFDGGEPIAIGRRLRDGQKIRIASDASAVLYSASWNELARFDLGPDLPVLQRGSHRVSVASDLAGVPDAELKVEIRLTEGRASLGEPPTPEGRASLGEPPTPQGRASLGEPPTPQGRASLGEPPTP